MKVIFYSAILSDTNLTITDKIVYSQFVYRSLWDNNEETFDKDGSVDLETYEYDYEGYVPIGWSINESIASDMNISRAQYYLSKSHLTRHGYISEYGIRLVSDFSSNFFELKTKTGLTGWSLIVYSYLAHKSAYFGWVDKYHDQIAKDLCISDVSNLEHILSQLKRNGFIQVKCRGKQRLLRTT